MTFEEWWKVQIVNQFKPSNGEHIERWETFDKTIARKAWETAKMDVKKRLENHDMTTMYDEVISEDNEEGLTLEGEIKKIIGD